VTNLPPTPRFEPDFEIGEDWDQTGPPLGPTGKTTLGLQALKRAQEGGATIALVDFLAPQLPGSSSLFKVADTCSLAVALFVVPSFGPRDADNKPPAYAFGSWTFGEPRAPEGVKMLRQPVHVELWAVTSTVVVGRYLDRSDHWLYFNATEAMCIRWSLDRYVVDYNVTSAGPDDVVVSSKMPSMDVLRKFEKGS